MKVKHCLFGETAIINGFDKIVGGMIPSVEEIGIGDGVFFGGFVADVVAMAIPAAAGVGEVKDFIEIHVEVGLGEDAEVGVIQRFKIQRFLIQIPMKTFVYPQTNKNRDQSHQTS